VVFVCFYLFWVAVRVLANQRGDRQLDSCGRTSRRLCDNGIPSSDFRHQDQSAVRRMLQLSTNGRCQASHQAHTAG